MELRGWLEHKEGGMRISESILIVVGIITAGFICWQAWETRRAAKAAQASVEAAQKSADAALLNAQAVMNAERSWIFVEQSESAKASDPKKGLRAASREKQGAYPRRNYRHGLRF